MEIKKILQKLELFNDLSDQELEEIAIICTERHLQPGEIIIKQGEYNDELYIITHGYVDVYLSDISQETTKLLVNLGVGQLIGEMALVDKGPRSATVRAGIEPTIVQTIRREDIENLCGKYPHIGYVVMRNIATDLSFKLRHRNLSEGGIYGDL